MESESNGVFLSHAQTIDRVKRRSKHDSYVIKMFKNRKYGQVVEEKEKVSDILTRLFVR